MAEPTLDNLIGAYPLKLLIPFLLSVLLSEFFGWNARTSEVQTDVHEEFVYFSASFP